MTLQLYTLNGHKPVRCLELVEWAVWMSTSDNERTVALDTIERPGTDPVTVSTIFLGIDHNHWGGPPILFESMVFGGPLDMHMVRYRTWAEAELGHKELVAEARTKGELTAVLIESAIQRIKERAHG